MNIEQQTQSAVFHVEVLAALKSAVAAQLSASHAVIVKKETVLPKLLKALHVIASQSCGPDWTETQALAFIKAHAREAIKGAK